MMAHTWAVLAVATLVVVLLCAAGFLVRVRHLAGQVGSFECAWRVKEGTRWFSGVASFRSESLEWYRLMSLSPRPSRSFARIDLEVEGARRRRAQGRVVEVRCRDALGSFDLAMMEDSYAALVAWVEAAAPQQPRLF
ncbi:DUF2550 family protein [Actinomyces sp. 2119]|uniref:DUF2550 family protein n=1 Tax=Actinomyces lilanjuaniae TaxID=2321394 RepID=A0ABM6Z4N0_9ACTO|nr:MULTISPECIES: DUF2550 family protein [Actinomyces]AYD90180.1 DUF2550 family protein [Actinomyces lilanjuaniae]RJF41432.1 DUF2550 family protein [Actinomyces sp. 2119]